MRKIILLLSAFIGITSYAQNQFSAGAHVGLPMMDASNIATFNIGLDLAYLHEVNPNFKIGAETGYSHFFGDSLTKDHPFIPIAAKAQYVFPKSSFFVDVALGYGISVNESLTGGFYAYPKVGYKLGKGEAYLGLQTLFSNGYDYSLYDSSYNLIGVSRFRASFGSLNLGYNFTFK